MSAILGIDAAWTPHHPSGIALIRSTASEAWECIAVEPSYRKFIEKSGGRFDCGSASEFPAARLLEAARQLGGTEVSLISADIPLAKHPITKRRFADDEVSREFGARRCAAHSPVPERPGPQSEAICGGFRALGFPLATNIEELSRPALIETYPHPALLSLMKAKSRVGYKACKTRRYWPQAGRRERLNNVIEVMMSIVGELNEVIIGIDLGSFQQVRTFAELKPYEDMIDALVCAWVGTLALKEKTAIPLGDESGAIWVPRDSLRPKNWSELLEGKPASQPYMLDVEKLLPQDRSFL